MCRSRHAKCIRLHTPMTRDPLRWLRGQLKMKSNNVMTGFLGGALLGTAAGVLFAPQIYAAFTQVRRELADRITGRATRRPTRTATWRRAQRTPWMISKIKGA